MTRLIDIELPLADALHQIDEHLERGEAPPDSLIRVAEEYSLEAASKRDRCARFFMHLDAIDELDRAEIARIEKLIAARKRAREWLIGQILIVMDQHNVQSLEGDRHRLTRIRNAPHIEPHTEKPTCAGEFAVVSTSYSWDKRKMKKAIEGGFTDVPAELVPGEWRLKIT